MKITKYPHSCLLIETNSKKILVDAGEIKYQEKYTIRNPQKEKWKTVQNKW